MKYSKKMSIVYHAFLKRKINFYVGSTNKHYSFLKKTDVLYIFEKINLMC